MKVKPRKKNDVNLSSAVNTNMYGSVVGSVNLKIDSNMYT